MWCQARSLLLRVEPHRSPPRSGLERVSSFATQVLKAFPPLLVELVRAGAPTLELRAEGFSRHEIDTVRGLIATEGLPPSSAPLDAGTEPARLKPDATAMYSRPAAARDAVTTAGAP